MGTSSASASRRLAAVALLAAAAAGAGEPAAVGWDEDTARAALRVAYATWCPDAALQAWDCGYCTHAVTREETAGSLKVRRMFGDRVGEGELLGLRGYVADAERFGAVVPEGPAVVVAFRGSDNRRNALEDSLGLLVRWAPANRSSARVHAGFLATWSALRGTVASAVRDSLAATEAQDVVITGHSLGAALANLAAVELRSMLPGVRVHLITFGSPRTGNEPFARSLAGSVDNLWRVTHAADIVPHLPTLSLGYAHAHTYEIHQNKTSSGATRFTVCRLSDPAEAEPMNCGANLVSDYKQWNWEDHDKYMDILREENGASLEDC